MKDIKQEVLKAAQGRWADILAALAPQLRPALEKVGRHVPCPVHGGKDGFRVFKDVDHTGGSICNTCGSNPDGFATLMWANDWSFPVALGAVAGYLRVGNTAAAPRSDGERGGDVNDRLRAALNRVWRESVPMHDRDAEPARLYLARRGILIHPPEALRFHRALPYYDGDEMIGEFPAVVAMVTGADGNPVTIHRTYLTPDGRKAPVDSPKKLMSYPKDRRLMGGAIRLARVDRVLAVAEGIETALAVMEATGLPVWCAVNAHLLANLEPPASVERVLVFADKDRPTEQHPKGHGQEAAKQLVQRLWESGIKASAIVPSGEIPEGQKSLDWNDVLVREGRTGFPSVRSIEAHLLRRAA